MKQLEALVREQKFEFFDLKYCDLLGRLRHVTLPIERLNDALEDGVGFDSSSVGGFGSVEASDMVLKPEPDWAFVEPFAQAPTVSCLAGIYDPLSGARYERDPRAVLDRALATLKQTTGADGLMVLPELEFYLFTTVEFRSDETSAAYRIVTDELRHDDQTGVALFKGPAYHIAPPYDRSAAFRSELCQLMDSCGIPVKYHHHEGGRFSQVEVEPDYMPAARAADAVVLTKYLCRNLAFRCNLTATFMPKPIYGEPGSGMHLHQYLVRNGKSLFGDGESADGLTSLARHYIAGILNNAPSLCAFTNPSTNSYRRLIPGFEAPVLVCFSFANRTAAIRIPGYIRSPEKMAIEYRLPDATANPYLALAAIVMAALDGIRRQSDPGLPAQGRMDDQNQRYGMKTVPNSLAQALTELRRDCDYLKQNGVFPPALIDKWLELKWLEVETVTRRPHPWEFNLYYGC